VAPRKDVLQPSCFVLHLGLDDLRQFFVGDEEGIEEGDVRLASQLEFVTLCVFEYPHHYLVAKGQRL
jgi:hypothetical protein